MKPVPQQPAPAFTTAESRELAALEQTIEIGLRTFHVVGRALCRIRDQQLYRRTHQTFESYCQEKWHFSRNYAWRLISGAEVAVNLANNGLPIGNLNEAQARELARLSDHEQQLHVWNEAQRGGKPTAARIEELTRKVLDRLDPEEQQEVIDAAEQSVLARHARQVGGEQRRDRLAQGERLLSRAVKIYSGLGDEAEDVIEAIEQALTLAAKLPAA